MNNFSDNNYNKKSKQFVIENIKNIYNSINNMDKLLNYDE
jgi:hypothetical protein